MYSYTFLDVCLLNESRISFLWIVLIFCEERQNNICPLEYLRELKNQGLIYGRNEDQKIFQGRIFK